MASQKRQYRFYLFYFVLKRKDKIRLYQEGKTFRKIRRKTSAIIYKVLKTYKYTGQVPRYQQPGHVRIASESLDKQLVQLLAYNFMDR